MTDPSPEILNPVTIDDRVARLRYRLAADGDQPLHPTSHAKLLEYTATLEAELAKHQATLPTLTVPLRTANWSPEKKAAAEKVLIDALNNGSKVSQAEMLLKGWVEKQGHDQCWFYPEIFRQLCSTFGITAPDPGLPPRAEFRKGCLKYESEVYGRLTPIGELMAEEDRKFLAAIMVPGLYRHHKGGHYKLLMVAKDCTNKAGEMLYAVYQHAALPNVFVRLLSEFVEKVPDPSGKLVQRFTYCGHESVSFEPPAQEAHCPDCGSLPAQCICE